MPKALAAEIGASIAQFQQTVSMKLVVWRRIRTPAAFPGAEQEAHAYARKAADDIMASVLRELLGDVGFEAQCVAGAHTVGAYGSKGFKDTTVTLLGGHSHRIGIQHLLRSAPLFDGPSGHPPGGLALPMRRIALAGLPMSPDRGGQRCPVSAYHRQPWSKLRAPLGSRRRPRR